MPRRNVIDVIEGKWLPWAKHERWICCDCNLTHEVEHRERNGKLEVRMYRANRSTAAYRREEAKKTVRKKANG